VDRSTAPHPVRPLEYQGNKAADDSTRVFDRVAGPNLRVRDNLIQLACVIVGSAAGAIVGRAFWPQMGLAVGLLIGLVASLILSGGVIGLIRFLGARRH
jgi:hypothetical protein